MPARSYLFVPGDRHERYAKALATAADTVVIDLEDAVAPAAKANARQALLNWLLLSDPATLQRVLVRINSTGTLWFADDIAMLQEAKISRFMLPKSESRAQLNEVAHQAGSQSAIVALIESVAGVIHAREIAGCPAVTRLAFGSVDFAADSGIEGTTRELDYVRTQLVLESRYASLEAPVDGVSLAIDDAATLAADVTDAKRFGFGGKLAIHPRQVEAINAGFMPDLKEIEWAGRVITAAQDNPLGAFTVDGKLVDKPVIDRARRIADMATQS